MIAILQISWRMWEWKNFENRPVFDEVMCRKRRLTFFGPPCITNCISPQKFKILVAVKRCEYRIKIFLWFVKYPLPVPLIIPKGLMQNIKWNRISSEILTLNLQVYTFYCLLQKNKLLFIKSCAVARRQICLTSVMELLNLDYNSSNRYII